MFSAALGGCSGAGLPAYVIQLVGGRRRKAARKFLSSLRDLRLDLNGFPALKHQSTVAASLTERPRQLGRGEEWCLPGGRPDGTARARLATAWVDRTTGPACAHARAQA